MEFMWVVSAAVHEFSLACVTNFGANNQLAYLSLYPIPSKH